MTKKRSGPSRHEKQIAASDLFTKPLSDRDRKELEALGRLPDADIDYSDAPALKSLPARVEVGRFYRPIKRHISLRVDADVLAWFRSSGKRYQTYMNDVLRREMLAKPKQR